MVRCRKSSRLVNINASASFHLALQCCPFCRMIYFVNDIAVFSSPISVTLLGPIAALSFAPWSISSDTQEGYSENDGDYSSNEEEEGLENLPWSEGGEGAIPSLGLGEVDFEHDDACSHPGPKYSEEELQAMVDNLYGKEGAKLPACPGGWGRGKWRPRRDRGDASP